MTELKINEQIAFLRHGRGVTQEELARALGVTNQSVSKWESGACCPDIQLLPDIAGYFGVSIDELMGYKSADSFEELSLRIKAFLKSPDKMDSVDISYKLAILCIEGPLRGYSARCDQDGCCVLKGGSMFISSNKGGKPTHASEVRDIYNVLSAFADKNVLRVLYTLYELTLDDFDLFVPLSAISEHSRLDEKTVEDALDRLPVQLGPDGQGYRIEGGNATLPPLLKLLVLK
ncbi:MAG: helix-turn-helix domain-containing protein [Eubacteriales bacterium]